MGVLKRFAQAADPAAAAPEIAGPPPDMAAMAAPEGGAAPAAPAPAGADPAAAAPAADPAAAGADPAAGGDAGGGATSDTPPPGEAGNGPPAPESPGGGQQNPISRPIDQLNEILVDAGAKDLLLSDGADSAADRIWTMYGGDVKSQRALPGHAGRRTEGYQDQELPALEAEEKATATKRWERLQDGKTIDQIVPYETLKNTLTDMLSGLVMKPRPKNVQEQGGLDFLNGQPVPPQPKQAARVLEMLRQAAVHDVLGEHEKASKIDLQIFEMAHQNRA